MNKLILPLCSGAWAIPASPLMRSKGNAYYTCSICGEPCGPPKVEDFNQLPTHLNEPTMVKIGTIMGQDLYIQLRGHDTEEREKNYRLANKMLMEAFGMGKK